MSDELVEIPRSKDNAILLLAAANELGVDQRSIRSTSNFFLAPKEVADKAFPPETEKKAPAKRAAKKTAAKKTAKSEE